MRIYATKLRRGIYAKRLNYYRKQGRFIPRAIDAYMPVADALSQAARMDMDLPYERQDPSDLRDL